MEHVYIAVSAGSSTAWVTLKENYAIARLPFIHIKESPNKRSLRVISSDNERMMVWSGYICILQNKGE